MKSSAILSLLLLLAPLFSQAATYEVPTDPSLAPYAKYDIQNYTLSVVGDQVRVEYDMPMALTGVPQTVVMSGTLSADKIAQIQGPQGEALCQFMLKSCQISYKNLNIDPAAVTKHLMSLNLNPLELQGRAQVALSFAGDPIGVIHFDEYPL